MKVVNKLIIMSIFVRSKPKKNIQQSKIITIGFNPHSQVMHFCSIINICS